MSDDVRAELEAQFMETFGDADFPVNSPMDLLPALPNGPATEFQAGDESFTAMELQQRGGDRADFPYEDPEELVEDILDGMEDEGYL